MKVHRIYLDNIVAALFAEKTLWYQFAGVLLTSKMEVWINRVMEFQRLEEPSIISVGAPF